MPSSTALSRPPPHMGPSSCKPCLQHPDRIMSGHLEFDNAAPDAKVKIMRALCRLLVPMHLLTTFVWLTGPPPHYLSKEIRWEYCNSAMSSVHRDPYKAGVRQTCTNRPNIKLSVLVNNSSLHCSYPSCRVAFHYISWFSAPRIG